MIFTRCSVRYKSRQRHRVVTRALSKGEWKAATVLAGSAIEVLLLWALQERQAASLPTAVSGVVASKTFDKGRPCDPEDWRLHPYVELAWYLKIIRLDIVTEKRLAKKFSNLLGINNFTALRH
jgi:hypothetical protein